MPAIAFPPDISRATITHHGLIINPCCRSYIAGMSEKAASRATPWRTVLIVSRKCGKKLDGGYGRKRKESLKTVLRQTFRQAGRRRDIRICETSCLGLCPKGGVTALNATHPGTIHVILAGTDGAEAIRTLLGGDAAGLERA
jgi:predicted metal-binding protein